ncbi:MAG: ROK family protein [Litoreibacter sp.]|nr:ROK family protein [Litoreibacter sp.]
MLQADGAHYKPLKQQVFEQVRALGQVSRIALSKDLSISPGSVTQFSSELISAGLIEEAEPVHDASSRGRPPVLLQMRADAGYVIGMKLGDFVHSAVLVDHSGTQICQASLSSSEQALSAEALAEEGAVLMGLLLEKADMEKSQIKAVGVGLAGIVDHEAGIVPWSPLLNMRDVLLRRVLEDRFALPVHIDNDANMLTLAELWFGAGRARQSFAVVTIEYGVGMGLVLDNRLFRGSGGLGLELGHTKVQLDGALCRCGKRGCLEAYLADYALVREARIALDMKSEPFGPVDQMLETLYSQAKAGNERARTIFKRAGRYLSVALSNIVHLFDPKLIILSGERMRYDYLYAESVLSEMEELTLDRGRPPPEVDINVWDGFVWARGAAALALSAATDELFGQARAEA